MLQPPSPAATEPHPLGAHSPVEKQTQQDLGPMVTVIKQGQTVMVVTAQGTVEAGKALGEGDLFPET